MSGALMAAGPIARLLADGNDPVRHVLCVGDARIGLADRLGAGVRIRWQRRIVCVACGRDTPTSHGGGHCQACFVQRAACDSCVRSPDRCHFHHGTCREPEWGRANCMVEHVVYLAHSSDVKVGITRRDQVRVRWSDQGAVAALPVALAQTRRAAGHLEAAAKRLLPDRTDWRRMVAADPPAADLVARAAELRLRLQGELAAVMAAAHGDQLRWTSDLPMWRARYPRMPATAVPVHAIDLAESVAFEGRLLAIKGQYLLLDCGAFNVRRHAGFVVTVEVDVDVRAQPVQTTLF